MLRSGMNGLFFAADTAAVSQFGHVTDFVEETILLQIPTAGGIVPPHSILHSGACKGNELVRRSEGRGSGSCAAKRQEAYVIKE